jgi:hypothetical protein
MAAAHIQPRGRMVGVAVMVALAAILAWGPLPVQIVAAATQSQSSAQALNLNLLHGLATVELSSPPTAASNDGTQPDDPVTNQPAVALLDNSTWLTVGALAETATARQDGVSYACAGVVQAGGAVIVGASEDACTSTGSGGGGVVLDLNALPGVGGVLDPLASIRVSFDSLTAFVRAEPDGSASGASDLVNAVAHIDLGGGLAVIDLPLVISPDPNQDLLAVVADALNDYIGTLDPVLDAALILLLTPIVTALTTTLTPIVSILTNYQITTPAGSFQVSALRIALLDDPEATALLATATAGPNQVTGLELVKSALVTDVNTNGLVDAGDTISYTFAVTNTGSVTISDLAIDDPMLAAAGVVISCDDTQLAPGEDTTCAGEYTITEADVDAGSVVNVATAVGTDPGGDPVESPSDEVTVETGTATPTPPLAVDDTAQTSQGTPVDVDVLANDSGDDIVVTIVTQPTNGAASINPDGTVRYTPNPSFVGTDTFTYTITDANGATSTATVTVTVDPAPPTAPDPDDPAPPATPPGTSPPGIPDTAMVAPDRAAGTGLAGAGVLLLIVALALSTRSLRPNAYRTILTNKKSRALFLRPR